MTTKRTSGLNAKEAKLTRTVFLRKGRPSPKTITEMAESTWPKNPKALSWTRNSLRKLLKLGILEQVRPGTYAFTPNGREIAHLAAAIAPKTPGRKRGTAVAVASTPAPVEATTVVAEAPAPVEAAPAPVPTAEDIDNMAASLSESAEVIAAMAAVG